MAVRKIPKSYGRHVTGIYPSAKGPETGLAYESALERDCIARLDANKSVIRIETQPVQVSYMDTDGKARIYTPDILVRYHPATKRRSQLLEVKPKYILQRDIDKYRIKFLAAAKYASRQRWRFRIVTEKFIGQKYQKQYENESIDDLSAVRIYPNALVIYKEKRYKIAKILDIGKILAKPEEGGTPEVLSVAHLEPHESQVSSDNISNSVALENISEDDWQKAKEKYKTIKPLLDSKNLRTKEMVSGIAKNAEVSVATIYNWVNAYEATGQVTALLPQNRKDKGQSRQTEEIKAIIENAIDTEYLNTQRRSIKTVYRTIYRQCINASLKPPHESTLGRWIRRLSPKKRIKLRIGTHAARAMDMAPGHFPNANKALDVAQIDHSMLDIILVDSDRRQPIGRPWLTLMIDVFSRAVLGFHVSLDSPSTASAGACIANAILPKDIFLERFSKVSGNWPCWGKMKKIHMDNAGEFRGRMMQTACINHGIVLEWRPVRRPEYGGHIERMMGTVLREIHELPGSTFGSPQKRGEKNPETGASMNMPELEEWLTIFIVDIYNRRIHSEIDKTPLALHEESLISSGCLPDRERKEERLRIDFMPLLDRTVQRRGIVIDGIYYYHSCLDGLYGTAKNKVTLRRNPHDLSQVYFYDDKAQNYVVIPYADIRRPVINLWELRNIRKSLKDIARSNVNEDQIFAAYERMRALEDVGKKETKRARRHREQKKIGLHKAKEWRQPPTTSTANKENAQTKETDTQGNIDIRPFDDVEKLI